MYGVIRLRAAGGSDPLDADRVLLIWRLSVPALALLANVAVNPT